MVPGKDKGTLMGFQSGGEMDFWRKLESQALEYGKGTRTAAGAGSGGSPGVQARGGSSISAPPRWLAVKV